MSDASSNTHIRPALAVIAPTDATPNEVAIIRQVNKRFQDLNMDITKLTQSLYPTLVDGFTGTYPAFERTFQLGNFAFGSHPPSYLETVTAIGAVYDYARTTRPGLIPQAGDILLMTDHSGPTIYGLAVKVIALYIGTPPTNFIYFGYGDYNYFGFAWEYNHIS